MANVMVVDDEAEVRSVLSRWLTAAGHQVLEAADSESALRALEASDTHVVLCDVRMPGKDGLWLASEIHRRFPTQGLLFATGETRLPPVSTLREGVVAYVLKPFDRERVLAAVADAAAYHETAKTKPAPQVNSDALERWLNDD
jgi:DNA-binding NtrC family response regulator